MQASAQRFVDSSISKTVNCPADISFDAFKDVYREGYRLGCKGLTTYRPNAITGSVLSVAETPVQADLPETPLAPRARKLEGATYKLKWPQSAHAVYVTINDADTGHGPRPFEIFVNSKNMDHYAWTLALTRMISAVFRRGGDVSFVADELQAVFDPQGGAFMDGRYVPSLPAAIGRVVAEHLGMMGAGSAETGNRKDAACCPKCGQKALIRKEGCDTCLECGHSKCG
jgi:ribonucleoside-diphosphate reductase alpha chain